LQDVGYLINYEKHHKHSYHLILNSGLPGIGPRELELIANVARYHRGAQPKRKHENFRQLPAEDRRRVRQLASILRLAGGLDRSHTGQVRDVLVVPDGAGRLVMEVVAGENPDVDIWSARRRATMFEKEFDRALAIRWRTDCASALSDGSASMLPDRQAAGG
jgi:exopolyphosphatase/guanosine-5'-triphosphate,3'-diphosphate pyrophosphatase